MKEKVLVVDDDVHIVDFSRRTWRRMAIVF